MDEITIFYFTSNVSKCLETEGIYGNRPIIRELLVWSPDLKTGILFATLNFRIRENTIGKRYAK